MTWEEIKSKVLNFLTDGGLKLLQLIGVFIVGYIAIKLVMKLVNKLFQKSKMEKTAQKFLTKCIRFVLYLLLVLAMTQVVGIPMTGFVALLSAAGLAVSLALQGSLSNLANGVVIISTKPFKEGDYVKISGSEGTVKEIRMLHTIIITSDNKEISIPNKSVIESEITNFNKNLTRKVVFNFGIAYSSDVDKAKKIISEVFDSNAQILDTPAPFISISALNDSSVNLLCSCFCNSEEYWNVNYYVIDKVFNEFKKQGIEIPYNQLEVRIKQQPEVLPYREEKLEKQQKVASKVLVEQEKNVADGLFDAITGKKLIEKAKNSMKQKATTKKSKQKKGE